VENVLLLAFSLLLVAHHNSQQLVVVVYVCCAQWILVDTYHCELCAELRGAREKLKNLLQAVFM